MINKFGVLSRTKYFASGIFQNCLAFIPAEKLINISVALARLIQGNLMEYQKKIFKILLNQAAILHQRLLIIMYYQTQILWTLFNK